MIQGTEEWHHERKKCIGGSDAPIVMKVSPWSTPNKLWKQKLGLEPFPTPTWTMERGIRLESEARKLYENTTGNLMFPVVKKHKSYEWMIGSVDGITLEEDLLLEIKCCGAKDHEIALQGKIPEKYIPQVQHYLEIFDVEVLHYWSYHEGNGVLVEVLRDKEYIKDLLDKEAAFMRCLLEQIPPEEEKEFVDCESPEWEQAVNKWLKAKEESSRASSIEEEAREELLKLSAGRFCRHKGVTISSYIKKGSVDYDKIPELYKVNLEEYRRQPTEVWRIQDATVSARTRRTSKAARTL